METEAGRYKVDLTGVESDVQSPVQIITGDGDSHQFVEFALGHEFFAVNLFHTREVITPTDITPLPNSPDYITGIMDLRGLITTIVDLKKMMNITDEYEGKKKSRIIILDHNISRKPVGILVDDVSSVSTIAATDIDNNAKGETDRGRNIIGVIRQKGKDGAQGRDKLILWLDIYAMIERIVEEI
ncbi:chemotaxis protein CheW [Methanospirillum sp.]|uniref:chemotaxis protein CheW n=1 Tax=Methanospirillum sp. TaxID=45200 RepID=UPI0035A0D4F7